MSAKGYLAFVVGMQEDDGRFSNFILDWSGRRNRTGPTSVAGGEWWTARALAALASGYATFGNPEYAGAFRRGLDSLQLHGLGAGAAAQAILALSRFWRATGEPGLLPRIDGLVDVVAARRDGMALIDDSEANRMHLWSRYLEVALVEAGNVLVRPALGDLARKSADAVLVPAARQLAWDVPVLPSEAGCTARVLLYLSRFCRNRAYQDLAQRAAAWFVGANAAREPVYDRAEQRFYDGVDAGPVRSRNAGAESNVEGALTLTLLSRLDMKDFR